MNTFSELLDRRRIVLCAGSGGVGKTTTSASLGLLAAQNGKNALCLTIDPARRLAQSLGLDELNLNAQLVSPQRLAEAGRPVTGSLTVMMLDTKDTFDNVVRRYASSEEARDRILRNRLYQYVASSLAGTQEYMAMEKLHEVASDRSYDVIILDTPPTSHALDFLDAPQKLIDAIDGSATRWLIKAFRKTGGLSFDLLAKPAAMALRGVSHFTGKGFLEQVGLFLTDIHDLFGGFSERARKVQQVLHGQDIGYVLVTAAAEDAMRDVILFAERLGLWGTPVDAVVINRFHRPPVQNVPPAIVAEALTRRDIDLGEDGLERLAVAVRDEAVQHEQDEMSVEKLRVSLEQRSLYPLQATVSAMSHDVHDIRTLGSVVGELRSAVRQ